MKKLSIINENIFDGIGKRSKGDSVRKENYVESVDLGLPSGTIWASCNLGASSQEECGDYYAWGETEQKDKYYWETYKFGDMDNLTKYNREDGEIILNMEDDAAHVILGGKWHIPTKDQFKELFDNTTNEDSELNGVKGRLFTSKINDNTLFFPYSGSKRSSSIIGEGHWSYYWSSSIDDLYYATVIYSNFKVSKFDSGNRCNGYSVRGVLDKK